MARSHRMTPARRAALRKAQLASAKKRRKNGVTSQARKSIKQRRQYSAANRALPKKQSKHRIRKAAVIGVATATVLGSAVYASRSNSVTVHSSPKRAPIRVESHRVFGQPTRALNTGPKGKAAIRSRNYRARQRAA